MKIDSITDSSFKFFEDKKAFLKILVSQLKYQDPSKPMSAGDFTKQLISFGAIEQSMITNNKLASMLSLVKKIGSQLILSGIGKRIEVATHKSYFNGKDEAVWWYSVPEKSSINWKIKDAESRVLETGKADASPGRNQFKWKGPDAGAYSIELLDASGNAIQTYVQTILTGVNLKDSKLHTALGEFDQQSLSGIIN